MTVKEQVTEIILKKCKVESIKDEDSLVSLGLDSLDLVEAMLEIEDVYHIEFGVEELAEIKTFKQVLDLIDKKLQ